ECRGDGAHAAFEAIRLRRFDAGKTAAPGAEKNKMGSEYLFTFATKRSGDADPRRRACFGRVRFNRARNTNAERGSRNAPVPSPAEAKLNRYSDPIFYSARAAATTASTVMLKCL